MKKQELFMWNYNLHLSEGCNKQLENYILGLLKLYRIDHQFITRLSTCGSSYILGMTFIVTKL